MADAAGDSPDAYVNIIKATVEMLVRDLGFVDIFNSRAMPDDVKEHLSNRFLAIVEMPMRNAQAAGRIRTDLRVDDTSLIVDMLGGAAHTFGAGRPADRVDRALSLILDAVRP